MLHCGLSKTRNEDVRIADIDPKEVFVVGFLEEVHIACRLLSGL